MTRLIFLGHNVLQCFVCVFQCFQNGFCEGDTAVNPGWAITSSPAENPAGTGMAAGHANVLFAPYVVPYDDASK